MTGRLTILTYHNIASAPCGALLPKLYVDPSNFARQMWCLKRMGLRGVSMSEGLWHLDRDRAGRVIALTFDDGYVDNLQHAASTLREFGFGATCFIVSGCVGAYNLWDAEALRVRKPLMDVRELKAWLGEGLELGSHTRSHPHLNELDADTAEAEIAGSRADLERVASVKIDHFCYPYGSVNARVARQVEAAGYRSAVTTQRGLARAHDNRFLLPRMSVSGRRGLLRFTLKAATPYGAWRRVRVAA
jgi:peptidoglycan/xylan/chitin deacetylase (PgdA/CDA1 family)